MELNLKIIEDMFTFLNITGTIHETHSVNVANLSLRICNKLHLNESTTKLVYYSSLLHDIGQVILPDTLLEKTIGITYKELTLIKTHVLKTISVLESLNIDVDLINIIKYHHERLDGSGYPYGTKDIPYETQILIIADVVEAMLSHRPYRPRRTIEYVADIICNSNKFNSSVASVCLDIINSTEHYLKNPMIDLKL